MCGFLVSNSKQISIENEAIIEKNLRFRGPDSSSGLKMNNEWISYHSRLAIIELDSGANQPVINHDKSQLVFNGEILNYKELGQKYFKKNYTSDTFLLNDLILAAKLDLNELDGFFAFVFIDGNGKLKYACRDKFGVKPLFFIKNENEITFSSEPNVLIEIFSPKTNHDAIEEYKIFRAPIFQGSFFKNIEQVEPGACFVNGRYFDLENELTTSRLDVSKKISLRDAIKKGVNSRRVADAKIGLLLSKGIDSNLIRFFGSFDNYYSIGFDGDEDIEYLEKQNIANLKITKVKSEEFKKAFKFLLELRKEPMSVPNEVMLFLVASRAKKDGLKVLLSGEGADEFFGGYDRIFNWAYQSKELNVEKFLEYYAYGKVQKGSDLFNKIKVIFDECRLKSPFSKVRWFFIKYHMPILFRRLDFSLMAAGIEGREPIANHHLFDVCKFLTGADLMYRGLGKRPLRELVSEFLGDDFAFEQKVGFPVDLKSIFSDPSNKSSYELWFEKNLEILK